jgi:transposase, IS5 family
MFKSYLRDQGLEARGGQIIDSTLVPVPKQLNSRQDNKEIKANRLPDRWNESPKRLQKRDLDARWVKNMISITLDIRTVFTLMLSTDLSDAL